MLRLISGNKFVWDKITRIMVLEKGSISSDNTVYMAHFFGSSAAVKFINAYHDNPKSIAAETFPDEANANKHVFYKGGDIEKPRTNAEVYGFFKSKIVPDGVNALKIGPAQKQNTPSTAQIHKTPSSSHA